VIDETAPLRVDETRKFTYPWNGNPIYELHVKGFTIRNPEVPEELRGKYSGLASPPVIEYLRSLGVTSVELMPIHQFVADGMLQGKGLTNYWGYNSIGFFAPDVRYASKGRLGEQVAEFREMVGALHKAGIEVILDVVYNHTAEGNHLGPTISYRGIDNAAYYRLLPDNPRYYMDYTGTGNTINVRTPRTLQLIMDSLRYWITQMGIDGFRFDLASSLARELHEVDRLGSFFDTISQDPVISRVKLIAEPWDVGEGGYQVGNFPPCGRSGTANTGTPCATTGGARSGRWASSPTGSPAAPTSTKARAAGPSRASTSSPCTTGSRSTISSRTTTGTTRPTARTTRTARRTTARGTWARRVRPTIPRSTLVGRGRSGTSWPP